MRTRSAAFCWLAFVVVHCGWNLQSLAAQPPVRAPGDPKNMSQTTRPADAGGSRQQPADSQLNYFPLPPNRRWHYDVEVCRSTGAPENMSAVRYVKDAKAIGGKDYVRMVTEVSGGTLRVPDQFYRVANNSVFAAVLGADGQELLVLPANPRDQKTWNGTANPSISRFSGVATMNESWQYGNQRFDGCVKVALTITIVESSLFSGKKEVPVRLDRWFAPGVGLVRELRIVGEEGKSDFLKIDSKLTRLASAE